MKLVRKKLSIEDDTLLYMSLIYMYLPILIFLLMWTKVYVALPVIGVSVYALFALVNDTRKRKKQYGNEVQFLSMNLWILLGVSIVLFVFCYYMGWSGGAPQTGDWNKHNAVLHDMINREWPVYYYYNGPSMLTYYIAQYIVPAIVGKLFGGSFFAAQIGMLVWNFLGMELILLWLFVLTRAVSIKRQIFVLGSLFFFGGMLQIAQIAVTSWFRVSLWHEFDYYRFLNYADVRMQYRTNLTNLRWVFQQCIVPWLAVLVFFRYKERRAHYVTMLLPSLLYASMSFLGLAIMGVFKAGYDLAVAGKKRIAKVVKEIFSIYNIGMAVFLGGVLLSYFWGNVFSEKPEEISLRFAITSMDEFLVYLIFVLCMFGIHMILMWKHYKKDEMYYIVFGTLLVIPLFKMGLWNDWCMCVSICPFFLFMYLVIRYVFDNRRKMEERLRVGLLLACIVIGAEYPVMELTEIIKDDDLAQQQAFDWFGGMNQYAKRDKEGVGDDLKYNYFTYDLEDNFFVNYLARESYQSEI